MARRFSPCLFVGLFAGLLGLMAAGCGGPEFEPALPGHEPRSGTLQLTNVATTKVLPGLRLHVFGEGFQPAVRAQTRLSLTGQRQVNDGAMEPAELELPMEYVSETELVIPIDQMLFAMLAGRELGAADKAHIGGTLRMEMTEDLRTFVRTATVDLTLYTQLTPTVTALTPEAVFLGDDLVIHGDGFLLEGEGQMVLVLDGVYSQQVLDGDNSSMPGTHTSVYPRIEHALKLVSRTEARLPIRSRTFGVQPGTFYGQQLVEVRQTTGTKSMTASDYLALALLRTQLNGIDQKVIRRGQRIGGFGTGFLPLDPTGDTATTLHLTGTFTVKSDGMVLPIDLTLIADVPDSHHLVFVPHPTVDMSGQLSGLGSTAGRFVGTIQPEVRAGPSQQTGVPLPCSPTCTFDIGSPLQVLYLKYLGNFTEGLRRFGMRNVEPEVRAAAMAVIRRTYAAWNVDARDVLPQDYDEFTTMEIGGPDPNGAGLFGLDNSDALDHGNLRLNDYIGGFNFATDHKGVYGFGGVFIESFLGFSPHANPPLSIASPKFDEIFGAFVPEFGGRAAAREELTSGERQAQLLEAVRVLGALIGGTIAHEFGHSLGMAVVPGGGGSHNLTDMDRELMDSGINRSFEERGEIGEYQSRPAGFYDQHRAYLTTILPHD